MSSVPGQRGRKVAARPLTVFYVVVGAVVVLGIALLAAYLLRSPAAAPISPLNVPVGQTEDGYWYKGNPNAPVTVIEYADYQCPACAYYDQTVAPIIHRDYIETGKVRFVYHEVPLDGHRHAVAAAEAARCAGDQGKFWEMHSMLYQKQQQWATLNTVQNVFSGYAGQLGLDRAAFDTCMNQGVHRQAVKDAGEQALASGVNATPTFRVNDRLVDLRSLPSAIELALRAAK